MNDANYVDGIIVIPATGLCRQLGQMDVFSGESRNSQAHAWRNNQGGSPWRGAPNDYPGSNGSRCEGGYALSRSLRNSINSRLRWRSLTKA
jgi:hypothetical protein